MYLRGWTSSRDRAWRVSYCKRNPRQLCCLINSYRSACHVGVFPRVLTNHVAGRYTCIPTTQIHKPHLQKFRPPSPPRCEQMSRAGNAFKVIRCSSTLISVISQLVAYTTWSFNLPPSERTQQLLPAASRRPVASIWSSRREQDNALRVPQPSLVHFAHCFSNHEHVRFVPGRQYDGYRGISHPDQGPWKL
jgi:hypothetical protein